MSKNVEAKHIFIRILGLQIAKYSSREVQVSVSSSYPILTFHEGCGEEQRFRDTVVVDGTLEVSGSVDSTKAVTDERAAPLKDEGRRSQ